MKIRMGIESSININSPTGSLRRSGQRRTAIDRAIAPSVSAISLSSAELLIFHPQARTDFQVEVIEPYFDYMQFNPAPREVAMVVDVLYRWVDDDFLSTIHRVLKANKREVQENKAIPQ